MNKQRFYIQKDPDPNLENWYDVRDPGGYVAEILGEDRARKLADQLNETYESAKESFVQAINCCISEGDPDPKFDEFAGHVFDNIQPGSFDLRQIMILFHRYKIEPDDEEYYVVQISDWINKKWHDKYYCDVD